MEVKNIDAKLQKEVEVTANLRKIDYKKEIEAEMTKAWEASKYHGRPETEQLLAKFRKELIETNYKAAPKLKQLLDEVKKITDASNYIQFPYSKQSEDFALAHAKLTYNDGKVVEPLAEHYGKITRKNMKSVTIVSEDGKDLFTFPIKNDKLIYRLRNLIPPAKLDTSKLTHSNYNVMDARNPKRCFLLETDGTINFVWDSGEVVEVSQYYPIRPYNEPELIPAERS